MNASSFRAGVISTYLSWTTWLLAAAANLLYGARITDEATCYKAFDGALLRSLPRLAWAAPVVEAVPAPFAWGYAAVARHRRVISRAVGLAACRSTPPRES